MKKALLVFLGTVLSLGAFLWSNKETSYTVFIEAPAEEVWRYVSDSENAKKWSIYFSHISALPGIEDGKVGSLRRCFRRSDESGPTWDEEVTEVVPHKYRQIRTFNLRNFPEKDADLVQFRVHQRYEVIEARLTKLTFGTELIGPWTWDVLIGGLAAREETLRVFQKNLENIKAALEGKERLHAYEP